MSDSRRIAKNTLMLYFRQILIMLVSLYTVRVVLNVLGAEDYGIYNVVAGVVVLFSFVNGAMAQSTQRYLNYFLGKKDAEKVKEIYSVSLLIHAGIAIVFVVVAETLGLWFVYFKLNIPASRHTAALLLYHFSVLTTVFNVLKVPYNAVIISYESMSFFAGISILEALLRLVSVFLLSITVFDSLVFYGVLLSIVSFIILFSFKLFCNKRFETAHFTKIKNRFLVKDLLSFSFWSLFGAGANVCNSQGTNIVLNMFTNVTVNAAMGIANQVNSAVYSFVSNFQTAFTPHLIKTYAGENKGEFVTFVKRTSKLSFCLLHFIALPLLLNTKFVLTVWLKSVPEYAVQFVQMIVIWSLIDALNAPLWLAVQAIGKIKNYQIIVSLLIFLNLPLCIFAFYIGASPIWVLYIRIFLSVVITVWRIFYLNRHISFSAFHYFFDVVLRCLLVFVISFFVCSFEHCLFEQNAIIQFFSSCTFTVLINVPLIFYIGMKKSERQFCLAIGKNKLRCI